MAKGVFCALVVEYGSPQRKRLFAAQKLCAVRAALAKAGAVVEDSELFSDELGPKTTTKVFLAWLAKRAKNGVGFHLVEDSAKRLAVQSYLDGYDAYCELQEAFFLAVAAAHACGAQARAGFAGDADLTDVFVWNGLRTEKAALVAIVRDEPQDLTDKDAAVLRDAFGVDQTAIHAAYSKWLDRNVGKKELAARAGCSGYVRADGTFAVEPKYIELGAFAEGRARFENDRGKCGYLDETGAEVIRATFDETADFKQGRGRVRAARGKYGFVDPTGALVVPAKLHHAEDFSCGRALVKTSEGLCGFIDPSGTAVIAPTFAFASSFADERAIACNGDPYEDDCRWGYLDPGGAWCIEPRFQAAGHFQHGFAAFMHEKGRQELWGLIDRDGDVTLSPRFASAATVVDGRVIGIDPKYRWGLYTPRGEVVIAAEYTTIEPCGALFVATRKDGTRMLFDRDGSSIGKGRFASCGAEQEGLVPVQAKANGPWGYIDLRGEAVIAPRFERAFSFGQSRALAVERGGPVVIDREGKVTARVAMGHLQTASGFGKSGLAWVECDGYGLVGLDGSVVMRCVLEGADRLDDALVWIKYQERD